MNYETPPAAPQPVPQPVRVALPQAIPYVTYAIIGVTVVVYLLQVASVLLFGYPTTFSNIDWLSLYGARINEFIQAGQLWRLLTPVLLHGSVTHIFFNMYALLSFGSALEQFFGRGRFLALYLLGAFAGNVTSFLLTGGYSVGASTAVFGLVGAEAVFLYRNRRLLAGTFRNAIGNVLFIIAINLFLGASLPGIDNWGHIGGLLGGLMFTWFASPLWEIEGIAPMLYVTDRRSVGEVITGAALVLVVFGALAAWKMMSG
ncbi:MAG: rhomboid family intramembrane serine protease [Chloroflexota bacterium]|nr:rhomboid family intramembrane serine protease [Chloroflexota bacterium]MBI5702279.1 rhomboid family intramembrane serine protease [Chloroflexota bacterium]